MVKSLQSLRGIFALMIFAHHYPWGGQTGLFDAGGDCGVAFFFILSGFVLALGADRSPEQPRWLPFIRRRLRHIYPLHILCLILFFILHPATHIGLWLPANLLLLQAWVPLEGVYFSGNAVGWCLSDFLFFYALFPLLNRLRVSRQKLFISLAVIYIGAVFIASASVPESLITPLLYISPATRLSDFLLGILLFMAISRVEDKTLNLFTSSLLESSATIILIGSFIIYPDIAPRWRVALFWWPSVALVIADFYHTCSHPGIISRLITLRPFQWLGSISFPYYMSHNLTLTALTLGLSACGLSTIVGHGPLHLLLSLLLTLSAATILTLLLRHLHL